MSPAAALAFVPLAALLAAPEPTPSPATEWLTERDGVVEMMLAHQDDDRVDGGTLRIDRRRKLVSWTGAPNDVGCARQFEAAFSDVKSVDEDQATAGFRIELRQGKPKSWVLAPLPHFAYLAKGPVVDDGGLQQKLKDAGVRDPQGEPVRVSGAAGGAGPRIRKRDVPPAVGRDVDRAIRILRDALANKG